MTSESEGHAQGDVVRQALSQVIICMGMYTYVIDYDILIYCVYI